MSTSRSVSVRHVSAESVYFNSFCYVQVARHVDEVCTGSTFFDVSGDYFDFDSESDFLRLCEALGKRLRLSGDFRIALKLMTGTEIDELLFGANLVFINGRLQLDLFGHLVFSHVH